MPNGKTNYLVGVDLGGTKILAGIFTPGLECVGQMKLSTKPERGPEKVIERVARAVREAIDECDLNLDQVRGSGIGAPGAVNVPDGTVLFAPNLDWKNIQLKKILEKDLDVPVFVENDCKMNALGVYHAELAGKPRSMIGVFLGTGIGAGIFIDGRPYVGFNGTAGEIGHMVIDIDGPECGCGNNGCFEALASRRAIFRTIQTAVKKGQQTLLTEMLGPELTDLRSGDLRKAIRRGDRFVERVIEQAAEYTGIAVGNLINLFNPEVIVLGGGIIEQLEHEMLPIIDKVARKHALSGTANGIEIMATRLGDNAGITGGAVLASRSLPS
ncbi:MAG TPA: ROK family protein [Verrucomicrobiae bacterium]|nr:ROK family protein [Verrucomicrobiae bacterium]